MKKGMTTGFKRVTAGLCAVLLAAGSAPVQPLAEIFRTGMTAAAAGTTVTVSSASALQSAVGNANVSKIVLTADISDEYVNLFRDLEIDLNGHTLTLYGYFQFHVSGITLTVENGDLNETASTVSYMNGDTYISGITVNIYDVSATLRSSALTRLQGSNTALNYRNLTCNKKLVYNNCTTVVTELEPEEDPDPTYEVSQADDLYYAGEPLALVKTTGEGGTIHYKLSTDTDWSTQIPTVSQPGDYIVEWYSDEGNGYKASGSADDPNFLPVTVKELYSETINTNYGTAAGSEMTYDGTYVKAEGTYLDTDGLGVGKRSSGALMSITVRSKDPAKKLVMVEYTIGYFTNVFNENLLAATAGTLILPSPFYRGSVITVSDIDGYSVNLNANSTTNSDSRMQVRSIKVYYKDTEPELTDISNAAVTMKENSAEVASVKLGDETLDPKTDYTVTYKKGDTVLDEAPVSGGAYTAVVTGTGFYGGSVNKSFSLRTDPTVSDFDYEAGEFTYDTFPHAADVTVAEGVEGMGEFSVLYSVDGSLWTESAPTDAGTYSVAVVTADGEYFNGTGQNVLLTTEGWTLTISPREITSDMITLTEDSFEYDGSAHTIAVSVGCTVRDLAGEDVQITLATGTDYTLSGSAQETDIGSYTAFVTGTGNWSGENIQIPWSVDGIQMSAVLSLSGGDDENSVTYTGSSPGMFVSVTDKDGEVPEYSALYKYYRINDEGETKLNEAPSGAGYYRVDATVSAQYHTNATASMYYTIAPATLTAAVADEDALNVSYGYADGADQFDVTLSGFVNGESYTASTKARAMDDAAGQHRNAGTYGVSFDDVAQEIENSFSGNYTLTDPGCTFTVSKLSLADATVRVKRSFLANADQDGYVSPVVQVIDSNGNTVPAAQYTLSGADRTDEVGSYDIKAAAVQNGNYCDHARGVWVVEELEPVVMRGRYLDLSGKIKLNIDFSVPDYLLQDKDAKVIITSESGTVTEKPVSKLSVSTSGNYAGRTVSMPVPAPETADVFSYKFYDGAGNEVTLMDKDGYTDYAEGYGFSAAQYLDLVMKTPGVPKDFLPLAEAMIDYTTVAQIFFQHGDYTKLTVSSKVKNVKAADIKDYALTEEGTLPSLIESAKMYLNLNDDSSLVIVFNFREAPTKAQLATLSCTIDGEPATLAKKDSTTYTLTVKNIAAPELDITHKFTVTDGTNTYTTYRSALSYAYAAACYGGSLGDLGKALFLYNAAANEYFGV